MRSREKERTRGRDRERIYYDILYSIDHEYEGHARITRVQNAVNLPSDRFRNHLREMARLGLLKYGSTLTSTAKGRSFIQEYGKVLRILKRFGLE